MSKKRFIQSLLIRTTPSLSAVDEAVKYAEGLWEKLSHHGYGEIKTAKLSEKTDWFKQLNSRQRKAFIAFWNAFNHKFGRNGAAMEWSLLGDKTDAEYKHIIASAKREAERTLNPGATRIMAQGWLGKRRYDDYQPIKRTQNSKKNHLLMDLNSQLNTVKKLYEKGRDEALLEQIEKLEEKIKNARQ